MKVIQKPDSINLTSVGNSALGIVSVEQVKNLLTPAENKPVTMKIFLEVGIYL